MAVFVPLPAPSWSSLDAPNASKQVVPATWPLTAPFEPRRPATQQQQEGASDTELAADAAKLIHTKHYVLDALYARLLCCSDDSACLEGAFEVCLYTGASRGVSVGARSQLSQPFSSTRCVKLLRSQTWSDGNKRMWG